MNITDYECILRLIISVLCGMAVGMEREKKNQAAGLRTHIAVILGATLVMLLSKYGFTDIDVTTKDPARLAAQVVSGIGFLGAGTIIVNKNKIRGLTTAASLWTTACIGLAVGAGFYVPAIATTVLLVGTLSLLQLFELRRVKRGYKVLRAFVTDTENFVGDLENALAKNNIILEKLEKKAHKSKEGEPEDMVQIDIYIHLPAYTDSSFLIGDLSHIRGVYKIEDIK